MFVCLTIERIITAVVWFDRRAAGLFLHGRYSMAASLDAWLGRHDKNTKILPPRFSPRTLLCPDETSLTLFARLLSNRTPDTVLPLLRCAGCRLELQEETHDPCESHSRSHHSSSHRSPSTTASPTMTSLATTPPATAAPPTTAPLPTEPPAPTQITALGLLENPAFMKTGGGGGSLVMWSVRARWPSR